MTRFFLLLATIACVSPASATSIESWQVRLASLTCISAMPSCTTAAPRRDTNRDRVMLAQRRFDCFDRCFAEFKACLGEPTRTDPPQVIPPNSGRGNVPTPPPFEFCLTQVKQACEATCVKIEPAPPK
jgi:hypothetical protein